MSLYRENRFAIFIIILILAITMVQGCFYDEGSISFRSRSKRFANTWDYQRVYQNDIIVTPTYFIDYVEFTKKGGATFYLKDGTAYTGTWDFNNHKDRVLFVLNDPFTNTQIYLEWTIELLDKTTLIAEEFTMGDHFRYEMKSR